MPDIVVKCTVCGAMLDEEDLFCSECGAEAPTAGRPTPEPTRLSTHNFKCQGCGASMSYDASVQALRCPFCGSEKLEKDTDTKDIAPQGVVSFRVSKEEAVTAMRQWLGQGFWRPSDLAGEAAVVKLERVYVPYWVFNATTHTYWTADSSATPGGARADWYPLFGQHQGQYTDLLVGGSGALTAAETNELCPFDLSVAQVPQEVDLENITFERFAVLRKYARPMARGGLESLEMKAVAPHIPGRNRNLKVNTRITDLHSRPMLLPVWIMAYRYRDEVFRFLCNGQTGRSTGRAPVSWRKIAAAVAVVIAVVLLFLLIMAASQ
jgi:hypothetical protein